MARKCKNCRQEGHDSRTCGKGCVKLFGVNLLLVKGRDSDGREAAIENNKGKKWMEEEHQQFLAGIETLGKGNWSDISKNFLKTRTPTQVASHSQKYFLRQRASDDEKKRSTIFDMRLHKAAPSIQDSLVVSRLEIAKTSSKASTSLVPYVCLDDSPPSS